MQTYAVTMGRKGSGSPTFIHVVHALSPDMAKHAAEFQNPGLKALSVRAIRLH